MNWQNCHKMIFVGLSDSYEQYYQAVRRCWRFGQSEPADWNFKVFKEVFLSCQDIRRLGSAALDMAYVACGRVDAFFEAILQPWDFSAAKLLIEEAGGKVTDFAGKELPVGMPGAVLAGNGKINEELLRILSEK